ncbi:MAG TPA: SGNH/GDSL hydrolase family protein [Capsulimonadaceae bacterium]|jgi:hypothetical protein
MYGLLIAITLLLVSTLAQAETATTTWELGKQTPEASSTVGTVTVIDGVVTLDGTNSFALPAKVLGAQDDYTIEFEVKRPAGAKGEIQLVSNMDDKGKTGLAFRYSPPDYNAVNLFTNGYRTYEARGFLDDKFNKITLVVKQKKLTLFRNGLILAVTETVNSSTLPLVFGAVRKEATAPYEVRNIKVYDTAVFPTGFDQTADRMRYVSGDGFAMQRADAKDPTLPRILVVGDSISMGYRSYITERYKGRAYVDYWVGGGWFEYDIKGDNFPALRAWDGVLANGPYDVVTWNAMTLHMWNGMPGRCSEDKYPGYMTQVVEHLQTVAPKTKFIWVRCTPWRTTPTEGRPGLAPERNDVIVRLNKATDEVMTKHGIPEVDLYSMALTKFDTIPTGSQDALHWNGDVSREFADEIAKCIEPRLPAKHMAATK